MELLEGPIIQLSGLNITGRLESTKKRKQSKRKSSKRLLQVPLNPIQMRSMAIHTRTKELFPEHLSQLQVMLGTQDILGTAHNRVHPNKEKIQIFHRT
jgi:hypothetical protein